MNIICFTNLDIDANEMFPGQLPCRPMVGDIIESNTGLELEVVRITFHRFLDNGAFSHYMSVELHLPKHRFENISTFEKWYTSREK